MKKFASVLLITILCFAAALSGCAKPKSAVINSAELKRDVNGNTIQAHGGQITKLDYIDRDGKSVQKWWWLGEDKSGVSEKGGITNNGIHAYSSDDLINWTDEGTVLRTPASEEEMQNEYFAPLYAPNPFYPESTPEFAYECLKKQGAIIERPKMIYSKELKKYVIWFHSDAYMPEQNHVYDVASAGIAISDKPYGPFRFINRIKLYYDAEDEKCSPAEYGAMRDFTLFEDNGVPYIIYSTDSNRLIIIGKLSASCTALAISAESAKKGKHFTTVSIGNDKREAPAVCKVNGRYYLFTSGCTYWKPNRAAVYSAERLLGEWVNDGNPCSGENENTTYFSQSAYIFKAGDRYIYMGDRWNEEDLSQSSYVWLPIEFEEGKLKLNWCESWTL